MWGRLVRNEVHHHVQGFRPDVPLDQEGGHCSRAYVGKGREPNDNGDESSSRSRTRHRALYRRYGWSEGTREQGVNRIRSLVELGLLASAILQICTMPCAGCSAATARWITKATESGEAVRAFQQGEFDLEKAMQEAQRLDALGLLADAVGQAQALESAVLKLHTSWRRLGGLQERLWVESGSSTPYLRDVLSALQSLSGATLRVSLGELAGGKRVRLQLVEESPDQLEPPPIP